MPEMLAIAPPPKPTPKDVIESLAFALKLLRAGKPWDRTEQDRRYAVTITDLEKVIAYFVSYVASPIEVKP